MEQQEKTILDTDNFKIISKTIQNNTEYFLYAKKKDDFGNSYLANKGTVSKVSSKDEFSLLLLDLITQIDA